MESEKTTESKLIGYQEQISGDQRQMLGRVDKVGGGGQKVQTCIYQINKSWECNVHHTIVNNTILHI